ncbi:MAG: fatty acid desaturase [Gemmatimonadales bacterium]
MREGQVAAGATFRHSPRDALLVALAAGYGGLLVAVPSAPLIAIGFWWTANTVAHNFIHLPFFRARWANAAYSGYLSLLLGLPQSLWRDRHLAHHAGRAWRWRWSRQLAVECVLVAALWAVAAGQGLLSTWLAGWCGGLLLCAMQGHYEHVRGTVSHYGPLYNLAFFNDGYHVEHHARPGLHWTALPRAMDARAERSRWPAVLRWLELANLNGLERLALHWRGLQRFMVERHARAFQKLLEGLPPIRCVTIIGGGLFPRTTLVLRQLLPSVEITIIDRSAANLAIARPYLGVGVRVVEASYAPELCRGAELLVVPLAFAGDRRPFYANPPAPLIAVHDWIWRRRGEGFVVSWLLLKRINLVRG